MLVILTRGMPEPVRVSLYHKVKLHYSDAIPKPEESLYSSPDAINDALHFYDKLCAIIVYKNPRKP